MGLMLLIVSNDETSQVARILCVDDCYFLPQKAVGESLKRYSRIAFHPQTKKGGRDLNPGRLYISGELAAQQFT